MAERLNAIVRLGAYVGVGLAIVQKEMSWVLLPIVAAVITMAWGADEQFENKKHHISRREKDLRFLAKEILSGNTRDIEHRHRVRKNKVPGAYKTMMPKRVYQDLDTSMNKLRNERAKMRKSLDGKIGDSPGFARKMMRRDKERYIVNGRKKYSHK